MPEYKPYGQIVPGIWWPIGEALLPETTMTNYRRKRDELYDTIAGKGAEVVPELVAGCTGPVPIPALRGHYTFEIILKRMRAEAVPALSEALESPLPRRRAVAFDFLRVMDEPEARAALEGAADSEYEDVRKWVAKALKE